MPSPRGGLVPPSLPPSFTLLPPLGPLAHTCHREAGPIALPGLPTVLVLGDAAVGGQGVLLLHVRDVQPAVVSNKKPVFWRHNQDKFYYSPIWAYYQKQMAFSQGTPIAQREEVMGKTKG